jgi:hypothetical protein
VEKELLRKNFLYIYKYEDMFTKNSIFDTKYVKKRILKGNLIDYKCTECNIINWNNKSLSLELHHIDGDKTNNLIENLIFLCPNCHSQTDNFGSRNINSNKEIKNINEINPIFVPENIFIPKQQKKKKEKIIKIYHKCIICNKDTYNKKFCSHKCYNEYQSKNIPDLEILINDFMILKTYINVAKKYLVSDRAVKKWVLKYKIEDIVKN